MTEYSNWNIIYRLQKWMDSVIGQTFLNYAYSWGAAIVILGTLFKLTYLPGANFFLYLGMGTEVFVFFLSAFDRPFDKTTEGMNLQTGNSNEPVAASQSEPMASSPSMVPSSQVVSSSQVASSPSMVSPSQSVSTAQAPVATTAMPAAPVWQAPQVPEGMDESLAGCAEELENLNRTLTSISKVYEMQLKSASTQISTIDDINEQTRQMAQQIAELNKIYARMIEAMSVQNKMQ